MKKRVTELQLTSSQEARYFLLSLSKISTLEIEKTLDLLNTDDIDKAMKFIFQKDRDRSLLVYAMTKTILGNILGKTPSSLSFSRNEFGKPFLSGHPLQFNLSHAGDYALLGFHADKPIGVDIEKTDANISPDSFLHPPEKKWLLHSALLHSTCLPQEGLFQLWSAKEAYVKALGIGFSGSMPILETICTNSQEGVVYFIARLSRKFPSLVVKVYDKIVKNYKLATCINNECEYDF